ncbi:MAG: amidase [Paracoccaceae bacterium]|nr:MAG: amidase [Paracoccaceae bacterium]
MNPADLPIPEAAQRLRAGSLTAAALTEAHLARIAVRDADVGAFVVVTRDMALAAAARADAAFGAGVDLGPMQGIPFAIKDLIDMGGVPSTYGSRRHAAHVPATDAEVVARLVAGGAVPIGKVATYEYALVGPSFDQPYPPARNPWNRSHITGGSSSGSAAAVAAGLVRVAIGTDTGGSVRSPACYCGVVGLKPTHGSLPAEGVFPLSPTLDHIGVLAATVDEAAICMAAMGAPPRVAAQDVRGLRIGYARDWFCDDPACHPAVLAALDDTAGVLTLLGARVELTTLPDYPLLEATGAVILHAEALAHHLGSMRTDGARYGRQAYQSLAAGVGLTDADLGHARTVAGRLRVAMDACLAPFDAVLTACVLAPAPPFSDFSDDRAIWTAMRTLPFNVTGHPVLALPVGFAEGLPLGAQIIARHGDEPMALRIGAALEAATDAGAQRPYMRA